jgi:hypothetical protein
LEIENLFTRNRLEVGKGSVGARNADVASIARNADSADQVRQFRPTVENDMGALACAVV